MLENRVRSDMPAELGETQLQWPFLGGNGLDPAGRKEWKQIAPVGAPGT